MHASTGQPLRVISSRHRLRCSRTGQSFHRFCSDVVMYCLRCWEREVLKKMSSHYKTQDPLSDDLIDKIIKRSVKTSVSHVPCHSLGSHSRYVNVGLFYLRQLFFANFDLLVHNNSLDVNTDYTKLWNDLREQISLVQGGAYKPGQGTFGHIVGGYDAGYYGYALLLFPRWIFLTTLCGVGTPTRSCSPQTCMPRCSKRPHWIPSLGHCTGTRSSMWVVVGTKWTRSWCVGFLGIDLVF